MAEKFDEEVATAPAHSRKERPTGSTHFGDVDFSEEKVEDIGDATWGEVFRTCCVHDAAGWLRVFIGITLTLFFLYFFLVGLELLGSGAKVLGGCVAGSLFGDEQNPVTGLMVGILATVLIQSSSSTTSIIVSLVGSDAISTKAGIYMVMGANIGTTVTNTLVALGHLGDGDELERAFAAATVHDMFNFMSVAILFPLEIITHYLYYFTKAMLPSSIDEGSEWEGPIKKLVAPLSDLIIKSNKDVTKNIAQGTKTCADYYPIVCENDVVSYSTCKRGLITCNKDTGKCPAFFQNGATRKDDETSGGVCFFLGLVMLIICLIGLVYILQKMLSGVSTRIIYKATNFNGYISMLIGTGITVLVQSSSITTSALTPFCGIGVIKLEQMYPLTLGANIGTTVTGLLASLVSSKVESLQVALCHLFFNITGILIWYPIPFMRNIILNMARSLGRATRVWKGFPILYIIVVFLLFPLLLLGISTLFTQDSKGFTVLGSFIVIALGLGLIWFVYSWYKRGLRERVVASFEKRQRRIDAIEHLPDDMVSLKADMEALKKHTGLPDESEGAKKMSDDEAEA